MFPEDIADIIFDSIRNFRSESSLLTYFCIGPHDDDWIHEMNWWFDYNLPCSQQYSCEDILQAYEDNKIFSYLHSRNLTGFKDRLNNHPVPESQHTAILECIMWFHDVDLSIQFLSTILESNIHFQARMYAPPWNPHKSVLNRMSTELHHFLFTEFSRCLIGDVFETWSRFFMKHDWLDCLSAMKKFDCPTANLASAIIQGDKISFSDRVSDFHLKFCIKRNNQTAFEQLIPSLLRGLRASTMKTLCRQSNLCFLQIWLKKISPAQYVYDSVLKYCLRIKRYDAAKMILLHPGYAASYTRLIDYYVRSGLFEQSKFISKCFQERNDSTT